MKNYKLSENSRINAETQEVFNKLCNGLKNKLKYKIKIVNTPSFIDDGGILNQVISFKFDGVSEQMVNQLNEYMVNNSIMYIYDFYSLNMADFENNGIINTFYVMRFAKGIKNEKTT